MSTKPVTTVEPLGRDVRVRDWLLDALTAASGSADAISFLALGKIFTAFMTGNLAFLGLAIAGNPGAPDSGSVLASMAGFAIGIYLATRIVAPSRRPAHEGAQPSGIVWPPRTTFALGVSLLAQLCFLVIWFAISGHPGDGATRVLLAVWAVAWGMQTATIRWLNVGGVYTTAATATFTFLFGDFATRPVTGGELRRMVGVIVSLVVGATAGGLLLIHAPVYAPVLPFLITTGVVVTAATAFSIP